MKFFNREKKTVSTNRFHPSNHLQLTAEELLTAVNKQKAKVPSVTRVASLKDLFGDDANHLPKSPSVAQVTISGRVIALRDLTRGVANLVSAKTTEEALILADWFTLMGKSLKKNAGLIDEVRAANISKSQEENKRDDLIALYNAQRSHEASLSIQDLNNIETAELQEERIQKLEATIASLQASQADAEVVNTQEGE